jgi:DegV family protein with EDD domain
MKVRIVTDSTCDLPESEVRQFGISVVPLYINIGPRGYLDGIELSRREFYTGLPEYSPHPQTGTPGPDAIHKVYRQLASEGASQILSIHISINLSATVDVARVAAGMDPKIPVTVFDSRQLSLGTGFLVQVAAQAAAAGATMAEILTMLNEMIPRTYVAAALDTLEYLRRSGRMNAFMAGIGSLLQLKPILKMYNGEPSSERVRTREAALRRLMQLLEEHAPLERVGLLHSDAVDEAEAFKQSILPLLPAEETPLAEITPVIGAHIGPGVVGFACVAAQK